jgi:hypothetical protein
MSKKIRLNVSTENSSELRKIQAEYNHKFTPATISLSSLADFAIGLGRLDLRQKLNLEKP